MLFERKRQTYPKSCVEIVIVHPLSHTEILLPTPCCPNQVGDNRQEWMSMMGKSSCSLVIPWGLHCGSDRVSKPALGLLPHQQWRIKELGEKSETEESTWKRYFYVHLHRGGGRNKPKYTAWRYKCLRKFILMNLFVQSQLEFKSRQMEVTKLGWGTGGRATKGNVVIMCYFFSSFR